MARKKASVHSDAQFALFVERVKDMLTGEARSEFDHVVRRLIGVGKMGVTDAASKEPIVTTLGGLPDPPDFDAIETAARATDASRNHLMALIGQLVFSSSNNESLLIYILMVLLQTDEPSAAIVFSTLNTTRARLDLVSRLSRIKISDRETRRTLDRLIKHFDDANKVRNELLHAMYTVDAKGVITHTQTMRGIEKSGRIAVGERNPIDQKRLDGIAKACQDLRSLNRKIWEFLPRLHAAVSVAQAARAATVR